MPTTLVELKHGYDLAGNRLYRYDQVARDASKSFDELYGYDDLNRLTSFDRGQLNMGNDSISGPTLSQSWSLDPQGNWKGFTQSAVNALTQTREHNEANEITDISKSVGADWPTPYYGTHKNGNTLTFPDPRSLTAELSGTYDAWNRLVKLENGGTVAEYQYDGANRRTVKTTPELLGTVVRHYYYSDQWQVLEERLGSSTSADQQQVWGNRYVDDLVLRDRFDVGPGYDNRLYALTDALFNVVALTDDDGAVVERFAYQAYGESQELDPDFSSYSGINYHWQYRFTGRELDLESKLQLNRNRYLHLQLGRWLSRDLVEYTDGPNDYAYCLSNPIGDTDPLGLQQNKIIEEDNDQQSCEEFLDWLNDHLNDPSIPEPTRRELACSPHIFCGPSKDFGNIAFHVGTKCTVSLGNTKKHFRDVWIGYIIHELVHCKQLEEADVCHCEPGKPKFGGVLDLPPPEKIECPGCTKKETAAYIQECEYLYPRNSKNKNACIDAGVCDSCRFACQDKPAFVARCKTKKHPEFKPPRLPVSK